MGGPWGAPPRRAAPTQQLQRDRRLVPGSPGGRKLGFVLFCPLFNNLRVSYLQLLELNILWMFDASGWGAAVQWGRGSRFVWHLFRRDPCHGPRRPLRGRAGAADGNRNRQNPTGPQNLPSSKPSHDADAPDIRLACSPAALVLLQTLPAQCRRLLADGRKHVYLRQDARPAPHTQHGPAGPAQGTRPGSCPCAVRVWRAVRARKWHKQAVGWGIAQYRQRSRVASPPRAHPAPPEGPKAAPGLNRPRAPATASGRPAPGPGAVGRGVPPAGHHLQQSVSLSSPDRSASGGQSNPESVRTGGGAPGWRAPAAQPNPPKNRGITPKLSPSSPGAG